jgi:Tfp pilus assembly protein PilF
LSHPSLSVARALLDAGNPAGALQELKKVFAEDPDSVDGGIIAAWAYHRQRKYAEAETAARGVLKQQAENMQALDVLADSCVMLKKTKQGLPIANEMIRIDPDNPRGFLARASLLKLKKKDRLAEADFQSAMKLDPGRATVARERYVDFLMSRDRPAEAAKLIDAMTAENAGSVEAAVLRGYLAFDEGRMEDARAEALWALKHDAENGGALGLLVNVKMITSPFMGSGWRFIGKIRSLPHTTVVAVLYGMVFVSWLVFFNSPLLAPFVVIFWIWFLGTLVWVPFMQRRKLAKEFKSVQVKPF